MKLHRSLLILALVPAALLMPAGCTKTDKDNATTVVNDIKSTAIDTWDSIKDFTYEQRVQFSASIDRMSKSMDDDATAARAKLSNVPDSASRDKEAALKDYDADRDDLKADMIALNNATAANWADAKAKVAAAWQRCKIDYENATK
jgi:hypothetical protein